MAMYVECPICGHLTDDGTIIQTKKGTYLLCFDCSESVPGWMLKQSLERMELEGSINYRRKKND